MNSSWLWADLARLDQRLSAAVAAADLAYGREAAGDRFRGLHIGIAEVERLLAREPGSPVLSGDSETAAADEDGARSRLDWLEETFELSAFDRDVVLLALAPEVDLRYERLYAYLQDDVTRRRPGIDLALNLLCESKEEKLSRRRHFAADAPLLQHDLLRLVAEPSAPDPPLLAHALKLDEQIVRLLLEDDGLDRRLAGLARMHEGAGSGANPALEHGIARALQSLGEWTRERGEPLRVHFHGPDPGLRRAAAEAVAYAAEMNVLAVDLAAVPAAEDAAVLVPVALREAWRHGAALHLEGCDRLADAGGGQSRWLRALARHPGVVILSSVAPLGRTMASGADPVGLLSISLAAPDEDGRRISWETHLRAAHVDLPDADVRALADRFRLTTNHIAEAVAVAGVAASMRDGEAARAADLFTAARQYSAWDVQGVARRITPRRGWDELVVPEETLQQLRELCQRALHSRRVLHEWGFDRRLTLGRGAAALFTGPSGTGKTMAAEVIANALGLDVYKVDLSGVVSKWIGETEKNLDRVFRAAEGGSGVLFFDEADALFGKRSEVRDSHDRYANVEVSYLLQRMEEHEGVAILATNLRANLDDAFIRRLSFVVHFPFPDESGRQRIWERIWPDELPREGLDLARLARELPLTGGNIRNVALAAAYLAADDGGVVHMHHVRQAVRREFQKMGKTLAKDPRTAAEARA